MDDKLNLLKLVDKKTSDEFPFNTIGTLSKIIGNKIFNFTGTLITKNKVLTTAKAVYNIKNFCLCHPSEIIFTLYSGYEEKFKSIGKSFHGCKEYAKLYENQIINKISEPDLPLNDYVIVELEDSYENLKTFPNIKIPEKEDFVEPETKRVIIIGYVNLNDYNPESDFFRKIKNLLETHSLNLELPHFFSLYTKFEFEKNHMLRYDPVLENNFLLKGSPNFLIDSKSKVLKYIDIIGCHQSTNFCCPINENQLRILNGFLNEKDEVKQLKFFSKISNKSNFQLNLRYKSQFNNSDGFTRLNPKMIKSNSMKKEQKQIGSMKSVKSTFIKAPIINKTFTNGINLNEDKTNNFLKNKSSFKIKTNENKNNSVNLKHSDKNGLDSKNQDNQKKLMNKKIVTSKSTIDYKTSENKNIFLKSQQKKNHILNDNLKLDKKGKINANKELNRNLEANKAKEIKSKLNYNNKLINSLNIKKSLNDNDQKVKNFGVANSINFKKTIIQGSASIKNIFGQQNKIKSKIDSDFLSGLSNNLQSLICSLESVDKMKKLK